MDLEEPEGEEEDCFLASMQDTLSRDLSLQRCSNFRLELDRHDFTNRGRRRGVDRLWALGYWLSRLKSDCNIHPRRHETILKVWIILSKVSAQPHTIVKQICFPNGNVLFLSLFSLFKNWMHNVGWGCAEILPNFEAENLMIMSLLVRSHKETTCLHKQSNKV